MTLSKARPAALAAVCCLSAVWLSENAVYAQGSARVIWQRDLATGEKLARRLKRPVLIHFHASWCRPCRKMERELFPSAQFRKQVAGTFVLVKVDVEADRAITEKYGVTALPTDVLISPTGRVLSRASGYDTAKKYLARLSQWETRYVAKPKLQVAGDRPPVKRGRVSPWTTKPRAAPPEREREREQEPAALPAAKRPRFRRLIGMDGYSPVAMHQQRKWVPGTPKYAWKYQGMTFWLANAKELREFKADPRKFAPRLLGCDPVVLNETDRAVRGSIRFGALFDGGLYFFVSSATRTKFRANPTTYTRTRHVLRVDIIEGTVLR